MSRRRKLLFCVCVIVFVSLHGIMAHAEEKTYIVKFSEEIAVLNEEIKHTEINVLTESELKECIEAGIVEWYEEDYDVILFEDEQESDTYDKWDHTLINLKMAGEVGCFGQDVKVAVIDSGINAHRDLNNNIGDGYNYIDSTTDVTDNIGHGTFVSGLIAAEMNSYGVEGVAPYVKVIPLKCFDTGVSTKVSVICKAIYDAVDDYNCDIINMSFGVYGNSVTLENAINYAEGQDVCLVASVGNDGNEVLYYPAAYENVIGVGSVDNKSEKSFFSQYNESVFVVAPGEEVVSTTNNGNYSTKNGTSFAAPQVTGMLAVMKNIDSNLNAEKAMSVLKETSVDLGEAGYDSYYGYGLIDISGAVSFMLEDEEYFISPVIIENGKSRVTVFNNSDSSFSGVYVCANYISKIMRGVELTPLNIESKETEVVYSSFVDNDIKSFIWNSITDIQVIVKVRERVAK